MTSATPNRTDAARRARTRMAMMLSGLVDLALAGFFLGWGESIVGLEERVAWLIAAALAAFGIATILAAMVVYGRRRRAPDAQEHDEPIVRR